MRFERKMKKIGNQLIGEYAKNPYKVTKTKTSFPLWAKISIPTASIVTVATVLSIVLVNSFANDINNNRLKKYALNVVDKPFNNESQELDQDYIDSINKFAADYYHEQYKYTYLSKIEAQKLHKNDEDYDQEYYEVKNMIYSPISITNMLYMLYDGTSGLAKQEIKDALYFDENKFDYHEEIKKMNYNTTIEEEVEGRDGQKRHVYSNISQAIFIDDSSKDYVNKEYLNTLTDYFYADYFAAPLNSTEGSNLFSDYLSEKSHGLFKGSPFKDPASESDQSLGFGSGACLLSTTYLESDWGRNCVKVPFPMSFTNYDGSINDDINYLSFGGNMPNKAQKIYFGDRCVLAQLPFLHGYSFNILFPNEGTDYQEVFNENILNLLTLSYVNYQTFHLSIDIPEMSIFGNSSYLTLALSNLGIKKIFLPDGEKFNNILSNGAFSLEEIGSETGLEIDNYGLRGSSYTTMADVYPSKSDGIPTYTMLVNRPFMFSITNKDNLPLYVGQVQKL